MNTNMSNFFILVCATSSDTSTHVEQKSRQKKKQDHFGKKKVCLRKRRGRYIARKYVYSNVEKRRV